MTGVQTAPADSIEAQSPACIALPDGSRPRVLLAEDSAAARVLTAALLRRMGCFVDAVEHGEEAVACMQNYPYDVVLMDIEMPVMDGVVATQEIRSLGGSAAKTPIIALSAFVADARKGSGWQYAFDGSIPKPTSRDQLCETLNEVLSKGRSPEPSQQTQAEEPETGKDELLDQATLGALKSQLKPGAWKELVKAVKSDLEKFERTISAGLVSGDLHALHSGAHRVRGVAATFGASQLAAAAAAIEAATEIPQQHLIDDFLTLTQAVCEELGKSEGLQSDDQA